MTKFLKSAIIVYAALLVQVTVLPAYIADPFKPNLLIVVVAYLGLREGGWRGALSAFFLGLVADCFRLYTDSLYLMLLVVFLATIVNGLIHLVLLLLFSVADGVYATLLAGLLPQALVNALAASLLFGIPAFGVREEAR